MLEYYLKLFDSFKAHQTSAFLRKIRQKILATIKSPTFSKRIQSYFTQVNVEGEPFTNFASEPKQVAQLKEIINALYHAELAFRDLETVDLRQGDHLLGNLKTLWFSTVTHGYRAGYLLSHLSIDLTHVFPMRLNKFLACYLYSMILPVNMRKILLFM